MKLRYLGTAAAEGIPALFCSCDDCKKAWALGGKNIRSRSQVLVNDDLLIDLPPDNFAHTVRFGLDLTTVRYLLISHRHSDHFYYTDLQYIRKGYSAPPSDWSLHVYGSPDIALEVTDFAQLSGGQLVYKEVQPFVPFSVGQYTVTALKAYHGTDNPYIYIITDGKSTMLYGHDTDIFPDETWEYLKAAKIRFDLVSLDCTGAAAEDLSYHNHMCLGRNRRCREMILVAGLADADTQFVLNHFSHNGLHSCYDDFAPIAEKEGFLTSYDGMEITF